MKTTHKKEILDPFLLSLSCRELDTCTQVIRNINSNRKLLVIALYANNTGAREFALHRIQENHILYEFCLNTDSPTLYDIAKVKLHRSEKTSEKTRFLKYLNMKEMLEDEYDDAVSDESYFIAEAS